MALETLVAIVVALLVGAGFPMQAGINATVAQHQGHPLLAAFTNTTVATLVLLAAILAFRVPWPSAKVMTAAPWWAWSGGALGAFFVLSSLVLAPKLGAAAFVATTIVGTMAASLLMDHYGVIGFRPQPITLLRLGGAVLVIAGMMMIQWKR